MMANNAGDWAFISNNHSQTTKAMKTMHIIIALVAGALLSASSTADYAFTVSVQGSEAVNVMKEGIKSSALTHLTISTNDEKVSVTEFHIVLARASSPLESKAVKGNAVDVSSFRGKAKAGDRIMIDIRAVSARGQDPIALRDVLLLIPIN
jgi:hypothetical protein